MRLQLLCFCFFCIFFIKNSNTQEYSYPKGLQKLWKAYPDFIDCVEPNTLVWKDGTKMLFDDGEAQKPIDTMLVRPDLEEMMRLHYPSGELTQMPTEQDEAGRLRYEPFFFKMYGDSKDKVLSNLKTVNWMPGIFNQKIKVTTINGVADKLQTVSNELAKLPKKYHKYLKNIGGTFNWRTVSGSSRMSLHSFGVAVDIAVKYANYWDWEKDNLGCFQYKNRIPYEIVEIFERHGFIWGGKWYHMDTMHFEYRPELLLMD